MNETEIKRMCGNCIHNAYCPGAYKKDHWCGNYIPKEEKKKCYAK